jgi:hypothetical protein
MRKKILFLLFSLFLIVPCMFLFTACDTAHEHDFGSELKVSDTAHWVECECGERKNIEAHTGGTATCTNKAVCEVCGFGYGETEAHVFNCRRVTEEYIATAASCTSKLKYYFSCDCGAKCSEMFEVGEVGHSFVAMKVHTDYICSGATCESPAKYYYSCEGCGNKSDKTFTHGNALGHDEIVHEALIPTCTEYGWD